MAKATPVVASSAMMWIRASAGTCPASSGRTSATPWASGSQPAGQLVGREEDAGDQRHRRDEQREVVHEEIVGRRQRVPDQAERGEGEPGEDDGRQRPQRQRAVGQAEGGDDDEDRGAREQRLGRRPEQFAGDYVGEAERRVEDGVPCFLNVHARKGRIQRLEGGGVHRRGADRAGGEEGDVGLAGDFRQHGAQPVAEAEHVDQRVGQIAEDGRQRQLAPDEEVAPPDRKPADDRGTDGARCHGRVHRQMPLIVRTGPSARCRHRASRHPGRRRRRPSPCRA